MNEEGRRGRRVLKKHVIFPRKKREEEEKEIPATILYGQAVNGQVYECVHTYFAWIGTYGGNEERMERNGKAGSGE